MTPSRTALSLAVGLLMFSTLGHAQLKAPRSAGPTLAAPPAARQPAPATTSATTPAPTAPTASAATDATADKETAGRLAALGWLLMLDRRDWGTAWEASSAVFRTQVPIAAWMDAIPKLREPLGVLSEREPLEVAFKTALAGRPDGNYVSVAFASKFSNKPDTQEIVTTALEADGRWRVIGYSTR